ncbi:acyl-CoA dehydrogenase family protein [Oceanicella actignis]|uniref:Pimeloyl-CoA dehydrogenase, small subunit n=1 Tax=Oceanicella actignis TaxID=1189325 RepID=A0A1M7THC0_9RHOB|nr:acyl-CoA dehydrogenase family protein [Oceanicella actignis]TYO88467.1 pimeloyl-CoA dehydrogenase small subunit [Oceanicella actignis]SET59207.1 pimeloyl-CoA dehydrogenase, small subunit [Oceanicella actignis]SHN70071.1 pimeloyl-CoA dehydrogenase, small subunit [Oceanicella actignis]
MDFDLNEEQRLLKESVDRLLLDRYDFEARKRHMSGPEGWSPEIWESFAELGLLALPFSEEDGGFGGGGAEAMLVMESFGRALVVEPYFATVILGGGLMARAASAEQRARVLPGVIEGRTRLAFAHSERQSRYDLADVRATAVRDGEGWKLNGDKTLVLHGDCAQQLIVSARVAGGPRDEGGVGLFLVAADAPGLSRRGYATQDGMRAAEVALRDVRAEALGDPEGAMPIIRQVADEAVAALCAEAVGAMERAHELTIEYLKTRQQFGVHIGAFQALQHRGAEMFVALEQARSMAMLAAMMSRDPDPVERSRAVSGAKVQVDRSGRFIGQSAIQLHGGVGMTMEYAVGHYFKRLSMIEKTFGDIDHHLRLVSEAGGMAL